jgi:hypothetical protein
MTDNTEKELAGFRSPMTNLNATLDASDPEIGPQIKPYELKVSPMQVESGNTTISFVTQAGGEQTEMLRVASDGFYVRGVKLEQDADEARKVFDAFTEWLSMALKEAKDDRPEPRS